jgi:acetyl-CoA carboxylase carboxyltransferase component
MSVGLIANNGILFPESALKATHFVELCNQRNIPLVFLQNIAGFIVGKDYERAGLAKDGAKMVHAVANANVPKFTVIMGNSYGAGNYAMSGRAYGPRLLFMWPNAKIGVMGGEQAATVLSIVKEDQMRASGQAIDKEGLKSMREEILKKYSLESSVYYSTSRLWDDGIIDPIDTRNILALAISASLNKKFPEPKTGVYRM